MQIYLKVILFSQAVANVKISTHKNFRSRCIMKLRIIHEILFHLIPIHDIQVEFYIILIQKQAIRLKNICTCFLKINTIV